MAAQLLICISLKAEISHSNNKSQQQQQLPHYRLIIMFNFCNQHSIIQCIKATAIIIENINTTVTMVTQSPIPTYRGKIGYKLSVFVPT